MVQQLLEGHIILIPDLDKNRGKPQEHGVRVVQTLLISGQIGHKTLLHLTAADQAGVALQRDGAMVPFVEAIDTSFAGFHNVMYGGRVPIGVKQDLLH